MVYRYSAAAAAATATTTTSSSTTSTNNTTNNKTIKLFFRVDHLYAFFVQWTPEIYGDEEEITPEKRGFVVINDKDIDSEDINLLDSSFQKDWEVSRVVK